MIFRPFYYYDFGCAAYLLGCGTLHTCAVVDARADDVDAYVSFARAKDMRITQVIEPLERIRKAWAAAGKEPDDLWDLAIGETRVL